MAARAAQQRWSAQGVNLLPWEIGIQILEDLVRNGFNPFTGQLEPGFRRNGRTFFIKMSYLFRRSFGG